MLTVVPTPLGNLRDITLRALDALGSASVIACEDTRRTRALLSAHGIPARELVACDERREPHVADRLVARALAGEPVALVSDSGMPLVADPGRVLVARALAAGCPVTVLPGPSAVETALVASGLAAEGYAFLGWVPRAAGERARFLAAATAAPLPSVAFESPRRLAATLADLARIAPEHPVAVARELTKLHEEIVHGSAAEVAARGVMERGEVCLVIAAAPRAERGAAPAPEALAAMRELVALGLPARRASELVARLTGAPRRALYDAAAGEPEPKPSYTALMPRPVSPTTSRRPIYYVNAEPHLGHAYTTIAADVAARHARRGGRDAFFLTGTDEHGTKIARRRPPRVSTPKPWADPIAERFRELARDSRPTNDFFIRTTDPEHEAFVQRFVERLRDRGDLYEGTYSGLYCTACEAFYTEADLIDGRCPEHGTVPCRSRRSATRSSASRPTPIALLARYDADPRSSCPQTRLNEVRSFVEGGLEDVSITRAVGRLGRAAAVGSRSGDLRLDRRAPQLHLGADLRAARAKT